MDLERWERLKAVFATLLELPPEERGARLAATLPDDPSLVAEVQDLLAAHDGAGDFDDRGALAAVPEERAQLEGVAPGKHLGPYRVLSELGRGGMGAVYLAERDEPGFTQRVAIKVIKRGMDTDEIVRRFRAERQILASLSHPNIARLLDGGSAPDGRPYFVMELIEGRPITAFAEAGGLDVEARLGLFLKVAAAVQSAHQSLVVHRDLKPANVLVDAAGEPKLLDFGIAKLLDPAGTRTALTGARRGPMTPDYASPEQRDGRPVTTATDVYSLGVLLYELLVGLSPAAAERRLGAGWAERPPSQAVRALADPQDGDKRRLARRVAGDLDTIIGKALEVEPERRYGTAVAFAEDVQRHLTQRPVVARRPTLAYRLGRTVVRHKLVAALVLGLVALAATASYEWYELGQQSKRVEAQRQATEASNGFLRDLIRGASPAEGRGESRYFRQSLDGAAAQLARNPPRDPQIQATFLEIVGTTYADLAHYDQAYRHFATALAVRKARRDKSPEAARAIAGDLTELGKISYEQGNYPASLDFHRRALAVKVRTLPKPREREPTDSLTLAENWNDLGLLFLEQGKLDPASRAFDRALRISRRAGGVGHDDLATAFNSLGMLAVREYRFRRARIFFAAALRYFLPVKGADHPDTLLIQSNLAHILSAMADYAGAEALAQQVAAESRRVYEPTHPNLAGDLLQLALIQRQRGNLAAAEATFAELREIRRAHSLNPEDEAESWTLEGAIALDRNQVAAAETAFARSYEHYAALPDEHRSDLADVLNWQIQVRQRRGDPSGALALARRRLEMARAAPTLSPGRNPAVAHAESQLGSCYLAVGDAARARPLLEESHRMLLNVYGAAHPYTEKAASLLLQLPASSP